MAKRFVRSQNGKYKSLSAEQQKQYVDAGAIIFNENEKIISAWGTDYVGTDTTYTAGKDITIGNDNVINHAEIKTTLTNTPPTVTTPLNYGEEFTVVEVNEINNGHVTGVTSKRFKLPELNLPEVPTGFTITPNVTADGVVNVKSQTAGTNGFSVELEHSKTNVNYTSGVESKSVGSGTTTVKVPSISVNEYGHITGVEDKDITITIPTLPEEGVIYSVTTGSVDGAIAVNGNDVFVKGLEDMAYATVEDKILSLENGQLKSTLTMDYDKTAGKIYLKGIDGEVIGQVETDDFIKDGMIDTVTMTDNILTITWNTDAGKEATTIDFSKYIDTFTHYGAENGIKVDGNKYVGVVKSNDPYLKVGADGFYTEGIDTAISNAISTVVNNLDATYSLDATGAGNGEISVITGVNLTQTDGKVTAMTVDSATAATKSYVDTQDETTLNSAKAYTDDMFSWEILA